MMTQQQRSRNGRLGGLKTSMLTAFRMQEKIAIYGKNPKTCKSCSRPLSYHDAQRKKIFCDRSCAATYNNHIKAKRQRQGTTTKCLGCEKEIYSIQSEQRKYCSLTCQKDYQSKERLRQWLEEGKDWTINIPSWAKRYLADLRGNKCEICDTLEWQGKPLILECDHKDGNHKNNRPENLRLICPNCHSQTDTYKNKNRGNGRKYR